MTRTEIDKKYYAYDVDYLQDLVDQCMEVTITITRDPQKVNFVDQTDVVIKTKSFTNNCKDGLVLEAKERNIDIKKTIKTMVSAILNSSRFKPSTNQPQPKGLKLDGNGSFKNDTTPNPIKSAFVWVEQGNESHLTYGYYSACIATIDEITHSWLIMKYDKQLGFGAWHGSLNDGKKHIINTIKEDVKK